jgi:hypothetical protein
MNQVAVLRSSVPFTTIRPVLTGLAMSSAQKRTLYRCSCIANFKREIIDDATVIHSDIIAERSERWECVRRLMQHKEQLEQEGKWPASTGKALEREFNSRRYCPKFGSCAARVKAKENFAVFGSAALAVSSIVCGNELSLPLLIGALGLYFYLAKRLKHHNEILTSIARKDLRYLNPIFFSFKHEQRKLIDAFREKDMPEECTKDTEKK